jgi:ABC-2 type transport system permease protein
MSLIVVAKKEFVDQIRSKRFIAILAVMLLFSIFSFYQGVNEFMKDYQSFVSGKVQRPSITKIFRTFGDMGVTTFGSILGLFMGFDLISREKETGSLKTLLSHPVYRDQIINGKAIGGFAALFLVVALTLTIALGTLTMRGFVPSFEDLIIIGKFGAVTVVFLFIFFSIGLFTSAIMKDSGTSLLAAFGIFITIMAVIPIFSSVIADAILGSPPDPTVFTLSGDSEEVSNKTMVEERKKFIKEVEEYWKKRRTIIDSFKILSPANNYVEIVSSLDLSKTSPVRGKDVTKNFVSFIIPPLAFFTLSYVSFLRLEIR